LIEDVRWQKLGNEAKQSYVLHWPTSSLVAAGMEWII